MAAVFSLAPHGQNSLKPRTVSIVTDMVCRTVKFKSNVTDKALLPCVDEKTKLLTLDRAPNTSCP
jgi:hypothetical protein